MLITRRNHLQIFLVLQLIRNKNHSQEGCLAHRYRVDCSVSEIKIIRNKNKRNQLLEDFSEIASHKLEDCLEVANKHNLLVEAYLEILAQQVICSEVQHHQEACLEVLLQLVDNQCSSHLCLITIRMRRMKGAMIKLKFPKKLQYMLRLTKKSS